MHAVSIDSLRHSSWIVGANELDALRPVYLASTAAFMSTAGPS